MIFYVKDNGVGFDQDHHQDVFKPFKRFHSSEEFEGTGIGLAIVEKAMARQGGSVCAEGEKGRGAIFYFSLPVD